MCAAGGMEGGGRYYGGNCGGGGGEGAGLVSGGRRVPSKGETKVTPPLPPSLSPHQIGGEMYRSLLAHQYDQYMAALTGGLPPSPTQRTLPPPTHSPIPTSHSPIPLPRFSPQQQALLAAATNNVSNNSLGINGGDNSSSIGSHPPLRSPQLPQISPVSGGGPSTAGSPTPPPPPPPLTAAVGGVVSGGVGVGDCDADERARHRRKQDQPRRQTVIYTPGLPPSPTLPSDDSGAGYCSPPLSSQNSMLSPITHDMPISQAMSHALAHPFLAAHFSAQPPAGSTSPSSLHHGSHASPHKSPLPNHHADPQLPSCKLDKNDQQHDNGQHLGNVLDNSSHNNPHDTHKSPQMNSSHSSPHTHSTRDSPLVPSSQNSPHMLLPHSPHIPSSQNSHSPHISSHSPHMLPSHSPHSPRMPPSHSPHMPLSHSPHMPLSHSPHIPKAHSPHIPQSHSPHMPPSHSPHMPPSHSPHMPPSHSPHMPPSHSPHMPLSHSPHMPPSHSPHMPPSHSPLIPPSHSPHMPPSHSPHMPPSHSPHIPPSHGIHQSSHMPSPQSPLVSNNNSPHLLPGNSSMTNMQLQQTSSENRFTPTNSLNNNGRHGGTHHDINSYNNTSGCPSSNSLTEGIDSVVLSALYPQQKQSHVGSPPRPTSENLRHSDQSLGFDLSRNSDLAKMELSHVHSPIPASVTVTRSSYNGPLPQATATAREVPEIAGSGPALDYDMPEEHAIENVTPTFPPISTESSNINDNRPNYGNIAASYYPLGDPLNKLDCNGPRLENVPFNTSMTSAQKKSLSPLKTINLSALDTSDHQEEQLNKSESDKASPNHQQFSGGSSINNLIPVANSYAESSSELIGPGSELVSHPTFSESSANSTNEKEALNNSNFYPTEKNNSNKIALTSEERTIQPLPNLDASHLNGIPNEERLPSVSLSPIKKRYAQNENTLVANNSELSDFVEQSAIFESIEQNKESNSALECINGIVDTSLKDSLVDTFNGKPSFAVSLASNDIDYSAKKTSGNDPIPLVNGNHNTLVSPPKKSRKRKHECAALSPVDTSEGDNKRRTRQRRAVSYVEDGTDPVLEMNDYGTLSSPGVSPTKKRGRKSKETKLSELAMDALSPSSTTTTDSQSFMDTLSPDRESVSFVSPMVSPGGRSRASRCRGRGRGRGTIANNNNNAVGSVSDANNYTDALSAALRLEQQNNTNTSYLDESIDGDIYDFPDNEGDGNGRGKRGRRGRGKRGRRPGPRVSATTLTSPSRLPSNETSKVTSPSSTMQIINAKIIGLPESSNVDVPNLPSPKKIYDPKDSSIEKPKSNFPFLTVKDPSVLLEKYVAKDDDASNDDIEMQPFRAMADLSQCLINSQFDSKDGDSSGDGFSPTEKVGKPIGGMNLGSSLMQQELPCTQRDDEAPSIAYNPRMGINRDNSLMGGSHRGANEKSAIEQVLLTLNKDIASLNENNILPPVPAGIPSLLTATDASLMSSLACNHSANDSLHSGPITPETFSNSQSNAEEMMACGVTLVPSQAVENITVNSSILPNSNSTTSTSANSSKYTSVTTNSLPTVTISVIPSSSNTSCPTDTPSLASCTSLKHSDARQNSVSISRSVIASNISTDSCTNNSTSKRKAILSRGKGRKRGAVNALRNKLKTGDTFSTDSDRDIVEDVQHNSTVETHSDYMNAINNENEVPLNSKSDLDRINKSIVDNLDSISEKSMDGIAARQGGSEHSVYVMSIAEAVMSGSGRASRRTASRTSTDNTSAVDQIPVTSSLDIDGSAISSMNSPSNRNRRTTRRSSQRMEPEVVVQVEVHPEPQRSSINLHDTLHSDRSDHSNINVNNSSNNNCSKLRERTPPTNQDDMDDITVAPERESTTLELRSLRNQSDSRSALRTSQIQSEPHSSSSISKAPRQSKNNEPSNISSLPNCNESNDVKTPSNPPSPTDGNSSNVTKEKVESGSSSTISANATSVIPIQLMPSEADIEAALACATSIEGTPGSNSNDTDSETVENIARFLSKSAVSSSPSVTENSSVDESVPSDTMTSTVNTLPSTSEPSTSDAVVGTSKQSKAETTSVDSISPVASSISYRDSRPKRTSKPPQSEEQINEVLMLLNMDDEESEDEDYIPKESHVGSDDDGSDMDDDSADSSHSTIDNDSDDSSNGALESGLAKLVATETQGSNSKPASSRTKKRPPNRNRHRTDRFKKGKSAHNKFDRSKDIGEPNTKRRKGNDGKRKSCDYDVLISPFIQLDPKECDEYINNEPYNDAYERPAYIHKASTIHFFVEGETKQRYTKVGFNSTLHNNYDAFNKDLTWFCALCKQFSHRYMLGDLFGPVFIEDITVVKQLYPTISDGQIHGHIVDVEHGGASGAVGGTSSSGGGASIPNRGKTKRSLLRHDSMALPDGRKVSVGCLVIVNYIVGKSSNVL